MTDADDAQGNAAQIAYWNDRAAVTWTAFQERLDAQLEPIAALALDAAAPAPGERAIDIGCGCGATLLALAERLRPSGDVVGLDISEPMAARARQRIDAAGLTNARVIISDAATHSFADRRADLLFSRFGVMFFADPVAAFANLRAAMRPNGRLLFAAWRPLADNPWFSVPLEAARPLLPPQPPPDPEAPGPFALADQPRTLGIFAAAGWKDVTLARHDVPLPIAAAGQIQSAAEFATQFGALGRILTEQAPETRPRVQDAVAAALTSYDSPVGIVLPGSIWLISARV